MNLEQVYAKIYMKNIEEVHPEIWKEVLCKKEMLYHYDNFPLFDFNHWKTFPI